MGRNGILHPLDNLIKDDRLFMLEALIPFVDDSMKAPIAMYIKITELRLILIALKDKNLVSSCGLCKDINNQEDILSSLCSMGFPDAKASFDNIKKAMSMASAMEAMNGKPDCHMGSNTNYSDNTNNENEDNEHFTETDLSASLKDIFDKYDSSMN